MQLDSDEPVDDSTGSSFLHGAVEALRSASRTPARQRQPNTNVAQIVDDVCSAAATHGLDQAAFHAIVDLVTSRSELDQASTTALVRHLFPAGPVSAEAVAVIVGSLGQGASKPTPATQTELVKWLVNAREAVDGTALSRLYGVLFALLDTLNLRTHLCHLLSLITRRRHVRPFRIQQLLELSRTAGPEPALLGLLRVFKDYYPDIIIETSTGKATLPHLNLEWRQRFFAILEANENSNVATATRQSGFKVLRRTRAKSSVIPEVHTLQAKEQSVTLEEIDTVEDLVGNLERIELPSQLIAVLADPLLQKYLTLRSSEEANARIDYWLESFLQVKKQNSEENANDVEFLEAIVGFLRSCKPSPLDLDGFIESAVSLWKGSAYPKTYLGLLGQMSIRPFKEFRDRYIQGAHGSLASHPDAPTLILEFYTALVQNWANILLTSPESTARPSSPELQSFVDLVEHVDYYILTLVISNPDNPPLPTTIFHYYTALSCINTATASTAHLPILFPPPAIVNALLSYPSLPTLSRLCALLASHKRVLESRTRVAHPLHPIPQLHLQLFNTHLMDTCNLLWRSRGLVADTSNPVVSHVSGAGCSPAVRQALQTHLAAVDKLHSVAVAFDLSHHPTMAFAAPVVVARLQDEYFASNRLPARDAPRLMGPVTPMSLKALEEEGGAVVFWKEFRVGVLEWLEERGAGGIKELMFGTMKDLMRPA